MGNLAQEICEEVKFDISDLWQKALSIIEKQVKSPAFETWFKSTKPIDLDNHTMVIRVPNDFARDWLESKYYNLIKDSLGEITNQEITPSFIVVSNSEETPAKPGQYRSGDNDEKPVPTCLKPKYTFDSFVVGDSNRFAHAAALAVAKSPAKAYNPLFIYGGMGLGKTHLIQAIGHFILESNPRTKVVYQSAEKFTNELINAIRDDKTVNFRDKYRNVDILLIEDIQFLSGKERTQEEFYHTFNALYEANKQIIISSNRPPKEIPALEEGLRSRFKSGLIIDIQPPDLETQIAILRRRAELENIQVPNDVINYIAAQNHSDIRELEEALARLILYSSVKQSQITLDLAWEALKDMHF